MSTVRILADDLTGALDTAAEFVGLCGVMTVAWTEEDLVGIGSVAFDTGTRERCGREAELTVASLVENLAAADIAYKKVDSLLRGPWATELARCWTSGLWTRCIVAPAFPFQGRQTRGGQQHMREPDGVWSAGADVVDALRRAGLDPVRARPASLPEAGICVVDAETDDDLATIAKAGQRAGDRRVLWCGSGGLARALVRGRTTAADTRLAAPVLGLFGSDQAITESQLAACGSLSIAIRPNDPQAAAAVARLIAKGGVGLVSVDHPAGTTRDEAAAGNAATFAGLAHRLDPPGTLLVSGGETLKALCLSLGTRALCVTGQVAPGLPRSVMIGGRWDGVPLVSKSGAFGPVALWRDLLACNRLLPHRIDA